MELLHHAIFDVDCQCVGLPSSKCHRWCSHYRIDQTYSLARMTAKIGLKGFDTWPLRWLKRQQLRQTYSFARLETLRFDWAGSFAEYLGCTEQRRSG
jgi:hypothetical protein